MAFQYPPSESEWWARIERWARTQRRSRADGRERESSFELADRIVAEGRAGAPPGVALGRQEDVNHRWLLRPPSSLL